MSEENKNENIEGETKVEGPAASQKKSVPKVAIGVAAASGVALLAVSVIGFAPALIAGGAGYLAYRGMKA